MLIINPLHYIVCHCQKSVILFFVSSSLRSLLLLSAVSFIICVSPSSLLSPFLSLSFYHFLSCLSHITQIRRFPPLSFLLFFLFLLSYFSSRTSSSSSLFILSTCILYCTCTHWQCHQLQYSTVAPVHSQSVSRLTNRGKDSSLTSISHQNKSGLRFICFTFFKVCFSVGSHHPPPPSLATLDAGRLSSPLLHINLYFLPLYSSFSTQWKLILLSVNRD